MTLTLYVIQSLITFVAFVAMIDLSRTLDKLQRRVRALEEWVRRGR